jgi:hypothetical protein
VPDSIGIPRAMRSSYAPTMNFTPADLRISADAGVNAGSRSWKRSSAAAP